MPYNNILTTIIFKEKSTHRKNNKHVSVTHQRENINENE